MDLIGEIRVWAGEYEPPGWTFCDGKLLKVSDFPDLYSVIGNNFDDSRNPADSDSFYIPRMENAQLEPDKPAAMARYIICYDGYINLNQKVKNLNNSEELNPKDYVVKLDSSYDDPDTKVKYKNRR